MTRWVRQLCGWGVSGIFAAAFPILFPGTASAQDTVKPALPPEQTQTIPQPEAAPKPASQSDQAAGAGAQVRTGSALGGDDAMDLAARLLALLGDHQFIEMETLLEAQPADDSQPAKSKLPPKQAQLLRGLLANRENKPEESIHELEPLLASLPPDADPVEEKTLRKALAEDYLRAGDLAKAAQAFQTLEARSGQTLTEDEREELELPLKLLPLVAANPPMTVEPGDDFTLPYDRDALGLTDIPVFVDGQSHDWMLDPTLPFNLICRSTAKAVGLKLSEQTATVHTLTGRPIQVHATVIPRFTVGTMTYRNMTAFVFDDADYYFPQTRYQVRGVLGYPAVSAMGSLTVSANANIEVHPGNQGERLTTGARFFLDGDRILAALGKAGDERMYVVDAGGQQTYLTSRYYAEHAGEFAGQKMQLLSVPGSEQKPPAPALVADSVTLQVGESPMTLHFLQVLSQPLGQAAIDDTYGTLGLDALDEVKSYTFDYRTMRFAIRNR